MPHSIVRVTGFEVIGSHQLAVRFSDGTRQQIDFRPVLHGPLFGPLQDLGLFNRVALDPEAGTLVWPNEADFDPSTLHDWPNVCDELAARARGWGRRRPEDRAAG
jgi:Protein of unknown function (DUF2442)